jgi:hypothetical protein
VGKPVVVDQSQAPLLGALRDYRSLDRYGFAPPGTFSATKRFAMMCWPVVGWTIVGCPKTI